MEPISHAGRQAENEGGPVSPSLFSFSSWKKAITDPKARRIELVLIFSIGIAFGIAFKNIAARTITIGYDDYLVQTPEDMIDFNRVERETLAKSSSVFASENSEGGSVCSNEIQNNQQ